MEIKELEVGNIIRFIYKADKSKDSIQNVELRITDLSEKHITGINVNRILDGTQKESKGKVELPYRTYKIDNIISGSFFVQAGIKNTKPNSFFLPIE